MVMTNPNFELQVFHDNTWSVIARIYNPSKKFYEHPDYINLTYDEARKRCEEIIKQKPSIKEIEKNWVLIGS